MSRYRLHTYFRSSASFRVRIALHLKGIAFESVSHHLQKKEHQSDDYLAINPQGLVPTLELSDGGVIRQSLAIIEYLDTMHGDGPRLIPEDAKEASRVRAISQDIACDVHPINNLRILQYLRGPLNLGEEDVTNWVQAWVTPTFSALEKELSSSNQTGSFCHGDAVTLADICLVPQIFNAQRFGVEMAAYPKLQEINARCLDIEAFKKALPGAQPDAE